MPYIVECHELESGAERHFNGYSQCLSAKENLLALHMPLHIITDNSICNIDNLLW